MKSSVPRTEGRPVVKDNDRARLPLETSLEVVSRDDVVQQEVRQSLELRVFEP